MHACTHAHMHVSMDGCMDRWMDGWMYVFFVNAEISAFKFASTLNLCVQEYGHMLAQVHVNILHTVYVDMYRLIQSFGQ